jgi:replication factor A1
MDEKYAKHVEEILSAVGNDIDAKEIEKEMKNYVEEFRLSISEAKKLIARKHGATFTYSSEPTSKMIKELTAQDNNVNLLCRVVFVNEKTMGTIPFTIWEKGELELEKGNVLKIESAYVNEWREQPQLNIGNRGVVTKMDDSALPPFNGEFKRSSAPLCKISEIGDASGNVSVVGRIITLETREVMVSGEPKDVMSGILADETGKISFTCWGKTKIKRGDGVKVGSGYLRRWRGMPQLNFDATAVEKSKEELPSEEELVIPSSVSIEELNQMGGMVDAAVSGVILDVRQGSGLVFRCPECNRVLQKNQCRVHGDVEGEADLRTKAVLDDGTGAMTVIMGRDLSEKLMGKSLDKCLKEAKKAMDQGIIQDQLFDLLVAQPAKVMGNVTSDDFGLMLIANDVEFVTIEPQVEARNMLEELL